MNASEVQRTNTIIVRLAEKNDVETIHEMSSYSEGNLTYPFAEDILVAERDGKAVGAVTATCKNIQYAAKEWKDSGKDPQKSELRKISGPWISRLFVFPEYRFQGIGTRLVEKATEHLKEKGYHEIYAGIHTKNPFKSVSLEIFQLNGFKVIGSCICFLSSGYCQGTLLEKKVKSSTGEPNRKMQKENEVRLADEITAVGLSMGADLVGFTSAEELEKGAPKGHKPSNLMSNAKSVIILASGRKLNEDRDYFYRWGPHFSLTYIKLKDEIKQRRAEARLCMEAVKNHLTERGYKVVTEPHGWSGILSFKMAAHLAGLGVFGKGSFLVNPQYGSLNVLACILTDAPLKYGNPSRTDVCQDCTECIKACKYGAYRKAGESFTWLPEKCRSYDLIMNPVTLKWTYGPCNSKCVMACPIGKSS